MVRDIEIYVNYVDFYEYWVIILIFKDYLDVDNESWF